MRQERERSQRERVRARRERSRKRQRRARRVAKSLPMIKLHQGTNKPTKAHPANNPPAMPLLSNPNDLSKKPLIGVKYPI